MHATGNTYLLILSLDVCYLEKGEKENRVGFFPIHIYCKSNFYKYKYTVSTLLITYFWISEKEKSGLCLSPVRRKMHYKLNNSYVGVFFK